MKPYTQLEVRGCRVSHGAATFPRPKRKTLAGSSTASRLVTATKRSIVDNARRGIAPPPYTLVRYIRKVKYY